MDGSNSVAHRFSSCLALALVLGASSGHLFRVSVWDIEQDTGTLLAAVGAKVTIKQSTELQMEHKSRKHYLK